MRLAHKVALVTGAGSGIGRAIATRFSAEGAHVLVTDIVEERAKDVAGEIARSGGRAAPFRLDVREPAAAEAAVAAAVQRFGRLDVQVSNAGVMDRAPFLDMSLDFWNRVLTTNLTGAFLCGQAAARQMKRQGGGRIINVSSNSGVFGGKGRAAYGASKAGIINLTQTMAIELAPFNIIVNTLAPGPTRTGVIAGDDPGEAFTARMAIKRFGEPEEIAAAALFLASGDCTFTTGHVLHVDGGFTVTGVMQG